MSLRLRPRNSDLESADDVVVLHPQDAHDAGMAPGDRVRVTGAAGRAHGTVALSPSHVEAGEVGIPRGLRWVVDGSAALGVEPVAVGDARVHVRRKLDGVRLNSAAMKEVMEAIGGGLSDVEVAAWAAGIHVHGMDEEETVACIEAMVEAGARIDFGREPIVDVHSIGGIPGNKYAPLCVSIVAEHGVLVPKTSSCAISSACGTADFMEALAPVSFTAAQLRRMTLDAGAVLAWGGGLDLAPADDRIVRVEHPLSLDPPSQLLASVLAKKKAVGATHVLIDVPYGTGAKMHDRGAADDLARRFVTVGRRIGISVVCMLDPAQAPLGHAIGPALEAREVLRVFEEPLRHPQIVDKACALAGRLLELGGAAEAGQGEGKARHTVVDGSAKRRFQRILATQGGDPDVRAEDIRPGDHHGPLLAHADGVVTGFDLRALVRIARAAGAPHHPGAGLEVEVAAGARIGSGMPLLEVYAESEQRLQDALSMGRRTHPVLLSEAHASGFVA